MEALKGPTFRPLYQQIKELLLERIASGEWSPGTFIPSEAALAASYNVSVGTLRKALNELVAESIVIRQQGKGTAVATHDADSALFRFFNIRRHDGSRCLPVSLVLSRVLRKANADEIRELNLESGAKVIYIQRVRELDDKPAVLESIALDAKRFGELRTQPEVLPNTLYHLYQQRFGATVAHADETLVAIKANDTEVKYLGAEPGEPLLEIRRIARDYQDQPIERRISVVLTRDYSYSNRV